jgi:hypothetical protein
LTSSLEAAAAISTSSNLLGNRQGFLKLYNRGYKPTKAEIFTNEEIAKFVNEAPDKVYLA